MGKQFSEITSKTKKFIENQKIFFVGTAVDTGRINISPKGMDTLKIIDSNKLIWLNLTGSANETAAHLLKNNRMTIMFCSFEKKPLIVRLYGKAKIYHKRDTEFQKYVSSFSEFHGTRQIVEMEVDLVQTSCGFAVPLMDFKEERGKLQKLAKKKNEEQFEDYWRKNNLKSIDGFDTEIFG